LFPAFENSSLETAKARLESMQIIAKHKRKAAEQAEIEVLEAENNVESIELEIEVIQRKGPGVSCDGFSTARTPQCAEAGCYYKKKVRWKTLQNQKI
jgi:hypothetical protein